MKNLSTCEAPDNNDLQVSEFFASLRKSASCLILLDTYLAELYKPVSEKVFSIIHIRVT
jgi:hypothetical protein